MFSRDDQPSGTPLALHGAALAIAISVLAKIIHTPEGKFPIDEITKTPFSLAVFSVMAVTVAPLFEELFFRGFIQPLLSRTFGVAGGVVSTPDGEPLAYGRADEGFIVPRFIAFGDRLALSRLRRPSTHTDAPPKP